MPHPAHGADPHVAGQPTRLGRALAKARRAIHSGEFTVDAYPPAWPGPAARDGDGPLPAEPEPAEPQNQER
jgi:hypothetical protein